VDELKGELKELNSPMKIMPTRWILLMLRFFAVSAVVGLAVAVFAPMPSIRFFGVIALACAVAGMALYLYLLHGADPHAWMVLRYQLASLPERAGLRWRAMQHRHDLEKMQP
jgi:hypothetical protein